MSNTLDKYKIDDNNRIMELRYFCRQYPLWVAELEHGINCKCHLDITGIKKTEVSDPTAKDAVKEVSLMEKCKLVEQSAIAASAEHYQKIIEIVTSDMPYKCFFAKHDKGGKKLFRVLVHKFFYILDGMKG